MTDERRLSSLLLVFLVENFGHGLETACSVCGQIKRMQSGQSQVFAIGKPICGDCVFDRIQNPISSEDTGRDWPTFKLWSLLLVFLTENFTSSPNKCDICGADPVRFGKAFDISNEWVCADCVRNRILSV